MGALFSGRARPENRVFCRFGAPPWSQALGPCAFEVVGFRAKVVTVTVAKTRLTRMMAYFRSKVVTVTLAKTRLTRMMAYFRSKVVTVTVAKTRLTRMMAYFRSKVVTVTLTKTRLTRRVAYIVGIGGGDVGQDKVDT